MLKAVFTRILISVFIPLMLFLVPGNTLSEKQEAPAVDFEAMLNLNYCYGTSFSDEGIAWGALLSLLELADEQDGQLSLEVTQLDFFTQALYGKTVAYADWGLEVENGRVLIPGMGYDLYTHTVLSVEQGDGQVKVLSKVVCDGHDSQGYDALCTSVFVENANSPFGYNLISSEILA